MLVWRKLHYRKVRIKKRTGFCKILISTYLKDGKVSFRTHIRGDFALYKSEITDRIVELEGLLKMHREATGDGWFDKKIPRHCYSIF